MDRTLTSLIRLRSAVWEICRVQSVLQQINSQGISLTFSTTNVSLVSQTPVEVVLSVAQTVTPGNYNLQTVATGGGGDFNISLTVQIVKYLIAIEPAFTPGNLTVPQGSTVTWLRTNGLLGEHGSNGSQNIVFNNGMASSPQLLSMAELELHFQRDRQLSLHEHVPRRKCRSRSLCLIRQVIRRKNPDMSRERFSFPVLVGIFVYFSAIIMAMAIFWETGIWFQSRLLSNLGTLFAVLLVISFLLVSGFFVYSKTRKPTISAKV